MHVTGGLASRLPAAYACDADDAAWLGGVVAGVAASCDDGIGAFGALADISATRGAACRPPVVLGSSVPPEELVEAATLACRENLTTPVSTLSQTQGVAWGDHPVRRRLVRYGIEDVLLITAVTEKVGAACVVGVLLPRVHVLSARERHRYEHVATDLVTGLGLLRAVLGSPATANRALGPSPSSLQDALRRHVRTVDRDPARHRQRDTQSAEDAWSALIDGRWTLVDHFESDGRLRLIARRRPAGQEAALKLSPAERRVATLAALGRPNKLIAHELGLPVSTASLHLATALAKLGVPSRGRLAATFGALVRLAVPEEPG